MILAVLEARCGLSFSTAEVYLNVAGGYRITDPAADLAVAAALVSALAERPVPGRDASPSARSRCRASCARSPTAALRLKEVGQARLRARPGPGGAHGGERRRCASPASATLGQLVDHLLGR